MNYGSGTVDRIVSWRTDATGAGLTLHVHSPDGTFLCEMMLWPPS